MELRTNRHTELVDITDMVRAKVKESGIQEGFCLISTRHTTSAIIVNENEQGLRKDIVDILETVVPGDRSYVHDRIDSNAHSHLRAVLLGMSQTIPIENGHLVLGTW